MDDSFGAGLLFASLFKEKPGNYVLVSQNLYSAQRSYEFLLNFLSEDEVVFFPADELLRAEQLSSSKELLAQRLYAMGQLQKPGNKILVTHPAALLRYLPNPENFKKNTIRLKVGQTAHLEELKEKLAEMGYSRVNKIDQSLQFAVRGDILDVFSVSDTYPTRIEFFGDEIEGIRRFDIASQGSKKKLDSITILPASDMMLDDDELTDFSLRLMHQLKEDQSTLPEEQKKILEDNVTRALESFVSKNYKPSLYKYYGFALNKAFSIVSYFDPDLVYIASKEKFDSATELLMDEARDYLSSLRLEWLISSHLEEYMRPEDALRGVRNLQFGYTYSTKQNDVIRPIRSIVTAGQGLASIIPTIQSYLSQGRKCVIALSDLHQYETMEGFLKENELFYDEVEGWELPQKALGMTHTVLNQGFEDVVSGIVYFSSADLFGHVNAASRFTSRFKDATILKSHEDLNPGDYVVHEYSGIGQFLAVETLEVGGVHRDYLHIAYAGNESLYVPLEQFRLVRKYCAREGAKPKLSHLSGGEWKKKKAQIKEKVNDLAERLVNLYGDRAKIEGFAFPEDDEIQAQFENEFPYQLTDDQQSSIDEIKKDMEKPEVMDRLLIGDVGFGKTEIAFRAIMKCILSGKQAALLCPTTLLARQHFEVACQRFSSFGVKIACFSRMVPESVQKQSIKELIEGKIDLAIGTHRLLSKEIAFRDLGLLVVDEEQRFGVEQKEKIKELKKSVDVLTLSATPIPRTLQMSLVGIRPLSQINTAPPSRMPIQTYVAPYKEDVASELIERELGRGGQVFYVYNKVESIYFKANQISRLCPSAKIGVAHGQMDKGEVEDTMSKFYDGEVNVLVCTSIVENGIDVPNANMIIVEDADRFGLSQLYQIKGRVGRGSRIAYAYLFYKAHKQMNEDAMKRLQAIQEFTELGSGYKIAQRDLLIRGAGDILGPEQAGFIDSVGLDLYLQLLNEAIEEKKTGVKTPERTSKKLFSIDAYIPKDYAVNADKIALYQELEEAKTQEELETFVKHMRDVYGRLPTEVSALIQKKRIDIAVDAEEFDSIDEFNDYVDVYMSPSFSRINGIGNALFNQLSIYMDILRVNFVDKKLHFRMSKKDKWMDRLETILAIVHRVYESIKENQR